MSEADTSAQVPAPEHLKNEDVDPSVAVQPQGVVPNPTQEATATAASMVSNNPNTHHPGNDPNNPNNDTVVGMSGVTVNIVNPHNPHDPHNPHAHTHAHTHTAHPSIPPPQAAPEVLAAAAAAAGAVETHPHAHAHPQSHEHAHAHAHAQSQPHTHNHPETQMQTETQHTNIATATATTTGRVSILGEEDAQGKRRFFPRVKHLIGNKEWETFLTQVLKCIEEAGAPDSAAASHKANNAWFKAFDLIYNGVAQEYSVPTGKNRYHKFKDKILEVWMALEQQEPGINHCRDVAMEQYERYKQATSEATKASGSVTGSGAPAKVAKLSSNHYSVGGGRGSQRLAGGKRSYSTAMGGGPGSVSGGGASGAGGGIGNLWKNLDETTVLARLPAKLRSLVHLKQLAKEMAFFSGNRPVRKSIEEHGRNLDDAYLAELHKYLADRGSSSGGDVDMAVAADEPAAATVGTPSESPDPEEDTSYRTALEVAFLYRYASTLPEQLLLAEAYQKHTCACVAFSALTAAVKDEDEDMPAVVPVSVPVGVPVPPIPAPSPVRVQVPVNVGVGVNVGVPVGVPVQQALPEPEGDAAAAAAVAVAMDVAAVAETAATNAVEEHAAAAAAATATFETTEV